ncbi:glycosyl transferase [Leptospira kobayashii]|uniref:Glycosyl transferase n=1 Tax=Leptospira kobayashii TaxID=1917830 RepID=A0ABN6KDA3_9LEPT|nr:glycosyltransferase family 2 protein [Leptospira kobayashii]BDA78279.1 glycosyl transferase [Leptospira kobayashii]
MKKKSVSFVIPCLNEEQTLPYVLTKLVKIKKDLSASFDVEILVSDNGSTDKSSQVAKSFGARVVPCATKGYGAALDSGIRNAKSEIIVFADADDTYDFLEAPALIQSLVQGNYDMVIGSRLDGKIHKGAMPFLHRYLGTPVINFIINLLYAKKTKIRDSNSGFRCFTKEAYLSWNVKSTGMEFASELLIQSLLHESKIHHVPVSLWPDKEGRIPHLKTWRDGMRHLLRILFYAPHLFEWMGIGLFILSYSNLLVGTFTGIVHFDGFNLYGGHSMIVFSFFSIMGVQIWGTGLSIATKQNRISKYYKKLLDLPEDKLFFFALFGALTLISSLVYTIIQWKKNQYQFINFEHQLLFLTTTSLSIFVITFQTVSAHIMKRE